ncbi:MAG: segregation/condensation protein A [Oscillospiraceae bacterium]|nr:segregation/condensation protein A [Oscillospiraceae bacterium]
MMESPVFRLEGVVKTKDEFSDFIGPLALILQLLSRDKIEIKDISISLILEQYLEYLDKMANLDIDIASEFVAMASHLAYIKSKMLLTEEREVTELEELISSLEQLQQNDIYMQIKATTEVFSKMYARGGVMMEKPPEYLPPSTVGQYDHDGDDLLEAILRVVGKENALISSLNPRESETAYPQRIIYSIPEKISEILGNLRLNGVMELRQLFYESHSRTELVATFVAVLELCRAGRVLLTGTADDMTISHTGKSLDSEFDFTESEED